MILIPIHSIELERIFSILHSNNINLLAITAAELDEGVTTLAISLAKRAAEDNKTLLVGLNLARSSIGEYYQQSFVNKGGLIESIENNIKKTDVKNLSILPAPTSTEFIFELRNQTTLKKCFNQWTQEFDTVIIDCSPLNSTNKKLIPAELVCAAAEACLMIVLAGQTIEGKINEAVSKLTKIKANLIGTVLNDRFNPRLSEALYKETKRFDKRFPKLMSKLRNKIRNSSLLNIDV